MPPPKLYKTKICADYMKNGACPRGAMCTFAHSVMEIRSPLSTSTPQDPGQLEGAPGRRVSGASTVASDAGRGGRGGRRGRAKGTSGGRGGGGPPAPADPAGGGDIGTTALGDDADADVVGGVVSQRGRGKARSTAGRGAVRGRGAAGAGASQGPNQDAHSDDRSGGRDVSQHNRAHSGRGGGKTGRGGGQDGRGQGGKKGIVSATDDGTSKTRPTACGIDGQKPENGRGGRNGTTAPGRGTGQGSKVGEAAGGKMSRIKIKQESDESGVADRGPRSIGGHDQQVHARGRGGRGRSGSGHGRDTVNAVGGARSEVGVTNEEDANSRGRGRRDGRSGRGGRARALNNHSRDGAHARSDGSVGGSGRRGSGSTASSRVTDSRVGIMSRGRGGRGGRGGRSRAANGPGRGGSNVSGGGGGGRGSSSSSSSSSNNDSSDNSDDNGVDNEVADFLLKYSFLLGSTTGQAQVRFRSSASQLTAVGANFRVDLPDTLRFAPMPDPLGTQPHTCQISALEYLREADYTIEWNDVVARVWQQIERASEMVDGLATELQKLVDGFHPPHLPPCAPPPRGPGPGVLGSAATAFNRGHDKVSTTSQLRYLVVNVQGLRAEIMMMQSDKDRDKRKWESMLEGVETAFELIDRLLQKTDDWSAILVHSQVNGGPMLAFHCSDLLKQQLDALDLIRDHARECCNKAREKCQLEHDKLDRRLYPLWEERDEVKDSIGHKKWTTNPEPKNDYAEKRRQNEEELEELIKVLQRLNDLAESRVYGTD